MDLQSITDDKQDDPASKDTKISQYVTQLLEEFEKDTPQVKSSTRYRVSRAVSALAVLYEKARNAVEFRADHLVRRASIERILKRFIFLNTNATTASENLILELLWAKYIDSSLVDDQKVSEIKKIIDKYLYIKQNYFINSSKFQGISWDSLLGVASTEIDEQIVSAKKRIALNNFFYQAMRPNVVIPDQDERYVNMLTYIAVERAYAQSDDAIISSHLLMLVQPDWFHISGAQDLEQQKENFFAHMHLIQDGLHDPLMVSISRYVAKQTPPFLLIRDFLFENAASARSVIHNPKELDEKLSHIATRRYSEIGTKVRRAIIRSIIYIFLTKMIFALALEAPFDLFISKHIAYGAIAINTLFPPVMLYLVAGFVSVPGAENTRLLIAQIHNILYGFQNVRNDTDKFLYKQPARRPVLNAVFTVFYLVTFIIVFGIINWGLSILEFSIASKLIFVFFVTLVSFFAYRIRVSAKEYEVVERQGLFEPVADFFFLPILRAGHWLSGEIAKLNIFIVIFDFILEAPLKTIFEIIEEWIRFIRTKKEEII